MNSHNGVRTLNRVGLLIVGVVVALAMLISGLTGGGSAGC